MKLIQDTPQARKMTTVSQRSRADEIIKLAEKLKADVKRVARRSAQLCRLCYYNPPIGGRAITPYDCLRCAHTFQHGNTQVPVFCPTCAQASEQCGQCGADLEYRETPHATPTLSEQPKNDDL